MDPNLNEYRDSLEGLFLFFCVLKVLGVVICEDNIVQNQKMRSSIL